MNRLKDLRKTKGVSQQDLADYLNVSRVSYLRYENNQQDPSTDTLLKLASYFDVSLDYLLCNTPKPETSSIQGLVQLKDDRRVPVLGRVPAGVPIQAIEEIDDYVYVDSDLYKSGVLFALKVIGDSMSPDIQEGDIAVVLQTQTVDWSGQIYIVRINGDDVTVKKVIESSAGLELIPMNPKYGSMKYTKDQVRDLPIEILGRVVEIRRTLNSNKLNCNRR